MPYGYTTDPELEKSTNKVMLWGAILMLAMVAVFPLYRSFEPAARDEARAAQLVSLQSEGEQIWSVNCASCHGLNGEGGVGPALNSKQFLQASSDDQTSLLVSVGVPGTQMSAYSQDFGGPLTSEQIKSVAVFMRSWEPDAPDNPDWRAMLGG
jgi:mono/diheme cytochrome c family protein